MFMQLTRGQLSQPLGVEVNVGLHCNGCWSGAGVTAGLLVLKQLSCIDTQVTDVAVNGADSAGRCSTAAGGSYCSFHGSGRRRS